MWEESHNRRNPLGAGPHLGAPVLVLALLAAFLTPISTFAAAPVITALSASATSVLPGDPVALTVAAYDPDCGDGNTCVSGGWGACGKIIDASKTLWTITGGSLVGEDDGISASPYSATADWQAPAEDGTYTITVTITDLGGGSLCFNDPASTTSTIDILVSGVTSEAPVIDSFTAAPTHFFPGGSSELSCAATDPEGESVTYSWETDWGTVTPGVDGAATFAAATPGIATIKCLATDPAGATGSRTVVVSVSAVLAEKSITAGLVTPQRVTVDSQGSLWVADPTAGGLIVLSLFSGEVIHRLPVAGIISVAIDHLDRPLIGTQTGARLLDRSGGTLLALDPGESLGPISDVAVDPVNLHYGVLYRKTGRVVLFDANTGAKVASFGSTGDDPTQLRNPSGLAATATGNWVVADSDHGLVKVFSSSGTLVSSFAEADDFVKLHDVEVDADGIIYASDSFQDWVRTYEADGTPREALGTWGDGTGEFKTATGIGSAAAFDRLVVASLNTSSLQVFVTSETPATPSAPGPAFAPASLDFGVLPLGMEGTPQTVTLSNQGAAPLGIQELILTGDFSQTNDCGDFLEAGASCTFQVTFQPVRAGLVEGLLTVHTSAVDGSFSTGLVGIGSPPISTTVSISEVWQGDEGSGLEVSNGDEGGSSASAIFDVTLSEPSDLSVSVDYSTLADTATDGEDFTGTSGTIEFAPGETHKTVVVPLFDDALLEPEEESFFVELDNAVNTVIAAGVGIGIVYDDELCPSPNLILNPGAEKDDGSGEIYGWTEVSGTDWQRLATPAAFEGSAFFWAGVGTGRQAELMQSIDVSPFAAAIDRGDQLFAFQGWSRTDNADTARIVVEYRDAAGTQVLDAYDSGPLDSPSWIAAAAGEADARYAPVGTRSIRVRLLGEDFDNTQIDAFFDGLWLASYRTATLSVDDPSLYEGDAGTSEMIFTATLACPFHQQVEADFATASGTAISGDDFLPASGRLIFSAGETAQTIAVDVVSDPVDEEHEGLFVELSLKASDAVLVVPSGLGVIVNDDFCPQPVAYWKNNPALWPTDLLIIGSSDYDAIHIEALLAYQGGDASTKLARQMVATLFNLEVGSDPIIVPMVEVVDALLFNRPPGSKPRGSDKERIQSLEAELAAYNDGGCL